jgi:CcmD family protein
VNGSETNARRALKKAFSQSNLMENLSYLFTAYSIIFAAIVVYVIFLWRRQAQLDSRLRGLEMKLNEIRNELGGEQSKPLTASRSLP